MNVHKYIEIWMNEALSEKEKREIIPEEIYQQLVEIDEQIGSFKAPSWDADQQLKAFYKLKENRGVRVMNLFPRFALAAAAVITLLVVYFFLLRSPLSEVITQPGESLTYYLPDSSRVIINDGSQLSFDPATWEENRKVNLKGEAFFSVKKGSKFTVSGEGWSVTVLGTKFNVVAREKRFDVKCFEGKVRVNYLDTEEILERGQAAIGLGDRLNAMSFVTTYEEPRWIQGVSEFSSQPLSQVIEEIERQFAIEIQTNGMDVNLLFTGSFDHSDLESALNALSLTTGCKAEVKEKLAIFRCD